MRESIRWGAVGIIAALALLSVIGLAIVVQNAAMVYSMDIAPAIEHLSVAVDRLAGPEEQTSVLWWLIGAFVCIVVTTVDTQLIGFAQHAQKVWELDSIQSAGRVPYLVALFSFLVSMAVQTAYAFWVAGLRGHATITLQLGFDGVIPLGQYFMTL